MVSKGVEKGRMEIERENEERRVEGWKEIRCRNQLQMLVYPEDRNKLPEELSGTCSIS